MASLSSLFDLSRRALAADQLALSTTANNVANQNTVGYVRQTVSFQQGDTVTLGGTRSLGTGVTASISARRDRVLEQRVQQQTQTQAETESRATVVGQIQNVFGISGSSATAGSTALGSSLDAFFGSLTALEANPADLTTRQAVLNAAGTLAGTFRDASKALDSVQQSVDSGVQSATTQINALTLTIARLNAQIGTNSPDADAGALEDQRQQAVAQLSQLVGLDQVANESNGLSLTTAGGTVLVAGSTAFALHTVKSAAGTLVSDQSGNDVTATIAGGSLGGLLTAQAKDLPATRGGLDALAYRVATAVNAQNAAGVDGKGQPGGELFAITPAVAGAASAIAVSVDAPSAIAAALPSEGATGNGNATALAALASGVQGGVTIAGQLAALLGQVGSTGSSLRAQSTAQTASLTQLTSQRNALSAVSLDEEAAALSQYQRSYQAAAKLFQIIDQLLASSINLGQQTNVA